MFPKVDLARVVVTMRTFGLEVPASVFGSTVVSCVYWYAGVDEEYISDERRGCVCMLAKAQGGHGLMGGDVDCCTPNYRR